MVSHLYNISFIFLTSPFMVDFIVYIRVIRVIRSSYHPLFSFVIMSFCLQKNHLSSFVIMSFCPQKNHLSPFVIMSFCLQENHLSPFVIMSFCLQKNICLYFSLCHSVSKKSSVSICHYVILSSKIPLSSSVPLLFCLQKSPCLRPSLCYSVLKHSSVFVRLPVILSLIYSVCLMLKCLYKEVYKGPEKRRGICIRSEYVTIMYSDGYR